MSYGEHAEFPCYGKNAFGKDKIKKEFCYRNMGEGRHIPQSYCRRCRFAHCESGRHCKVK